MYIGGGGVPGVETRGHTFIRGMEGGHYEV